MEACISRKDSEPADPVLIPPKDDPDDLCLLLRLDRIDTAGENPGAMSDAVLGESGEISNLKAMPWWFFDTSSMRKEMIVGEPFALMY